MTTPESCAFRERVEHGADGEVAWCSLLPQTTGVAEHPLWRVGRDACEACCRFTPPTVSGIEILKSHGLDR